MRLIFGLVLFFGITLAGSAVFLVQKYMTAQKVAFQNAIQERGHAVPTIPIFVMKRPVRFGEELRPSDVAIINWPKAANPSGSFVDGEILFPQNGAQRFVVRAMERGEPVLAVKITQPGENAGIRSTLTKGMRAFAINVNVQTGVSGFLRPGDRVDVYWTGSAPTTNGRRGRNVTRLIERSLPLIAVDQSADSDQNGASIARTVTVEITPQQVAALAQAQTSGRLSLSLVGSEDDTLAQAEQMDQSALLGIQTAKVETRAPARVCIVKTRRGAEVVEIPIPCTD